MTSKKKYKIARKFEDGGISDSGLGLLIGGLGSVASPLISNGLSTGVGNALSGLGSTVGGGLMMVNPLLGGAVMAGSQILGGLVNQAFGSDIDDNLVNIIASENKSLSNTKLNIGDNSSILKQWNNQDFGTRFTQSDIGKDGWFSNKAKNKYNELKNQRNQSLQILEETYKNAFDTTNTLNNKNALINFKAYGGPINMKSSRPMSPFGNRFKSGGSLSNDFTNGITFIDSGGTHEENPIGGIPMGIASDGIPNLVEEGEVKFNNYIFSNRLNATEDLLLSHNLPGIYKDHSFAYIAEKLSKESSERPNDPISKRGLMSSMTRLQQAQEDVRMKENNNRNIRKGNIFAKGGPAGINPDLMESDNWEIIPTGSKIYGNPYEENNIIDMNPVSMDTMSKPSSRNGLSWLRYAPIIGSGINVLTDVFGLTNKPDYTNADLIGTVSDNLSEVDFTPIGNYLTYKPLDKNYYINQFNAQSGATRRAIINQSGGNRATAMAGLLSADYNALNSLGELTRKSEEYNQAQRERIEAFNRGTNQFNSEMALKAAIANKDNDKIRLQSRIAQAQLREQAEARASAGRSANLTNLFDSLGEVGREEFSRNMIKSNSTLYYSIDRNGHITYKNDYDELSEAEKKSVREAANRDKKNRRAKGGYLTIRGGK